MSSRDNVSLPTYAVLTWHYSANPLGNPHPTVHHQAYVSEGRGSTGSPEQLHAVGERREDRATRVTTNVI
jgi:hypothetical protein